MSITLNCTHCGKQVQAPEDAGGRWGKCPRCGEKVYVPSLPSDDGEIGLVPLDEAEERRSQRERIRYQQIEGQALHGAGGAADTGPTHESSVSPKAAKGHRRNIEAMLVRYVKGMSDGRVSDCDEIVVSLIGHRKEVASAVEHLTAMSPLPANLSGIPPAVVKGYLRQLLGQL